MKEIGYELEARKVYVTPSGAIVIEQPEKDVYKQRLIERGLITRDLNSVGKCWWRAYTGEVWTQ